MERCAVRHKIDPPSSYLFVPSGIRFPRLDIRILTLLGFLSRPYISILLPVSKNRRPEIPLSTAPGFLVNK